MKKNHLLIVLVLVAFGATVVPAGAVCPGYAAEPRGEVLFEGGLAEAAASGRYVLLIFGSDTCDWCKALCEALEQPKVRAVIERSYVEVKVEIGHGELNPSLQRRFDINGKGIPYLVVTDANGKLRIDQLSNAFLAPGGVRAYVPELIEDFLLAWAPPPKK